MNGDEPERVRAFGEGATSPTATSLFTKTTPIQKGKLLILCGQKKQLSNSLVFHFQYP